MTDKPLAVGFGVSSPEHVSRLSRIADGVVVGSRILNAVERGENLAALVRALKLATRRNGKEPVSQRATDPIRRGSA